MKAKTVYACEYCGVLWDTDRTAIDHEKDCKFKPAGKALELTEEQKEINTLREANKELTENIVKLRRLLKEKQEYINIIHKSSWA